MTAKFPGIKNHVVVCGFGVVGQKIVDVLLDKNVPFIVIDLDEKAVAHMKELGYKALQGDATLSRVLRDASIDTAKAVAVTMDNDAKNLFTVLTARDLSKHVFIATRANDDFVREKLVEAGADYIVMPQKSASKEIVKELAKE